MGDSSSCFPALWFQHVLLSVTLSLALGYVIQCVAGTLLLLWQTWARKYLSPGSQIIMDWEGNADIP